MDTVRVCGTSKTELIYWKYTIFEENENASITAQGTAVQWPGYKMIYSEKTVQKLDIAGMEFLFSERSKLSSWSLR